MLGRAPRENSLQVEVGRKTRAALSGMPDPRGQLALSLSQPGGSILIYLVSCGAADTTGEIFLAAHEALDIAWPSSANGEWHAVHTFQE